jgi:arylsulfatase A-like enzyme
MESSRVHGTGAAALALLCALAGACSDSRSRYAHVVLISIDTLRADRLGCHGHAGGLTPAIDALAARGVRFANALAPAPTTLPSHTSLFTGTYPHTHGVPRNQFAVAAENVLLPEVLRDAGFATAGFVGAFPLSETFGFPQGFETWDEDFELFIEADGVDQNQRRAARVTDAALAWVDAAKPERAFLFVHYFDPHAPYAPPPRSGGTPVHEGAPQGSTFEDVARQANAHHRALVPDAPGWAELVQRGLTRELVEGATGAELPGDAELVALYEGEIRYVDAEIARLLAGLERAGLLEDALVVLTADHGETLFEHADAYNHGLWVHDTTVHVPLILAGPGVEARTVDAPVSTIDALPTILELVGLASPPAVEGVSLVPLVRGEPLERGPVFSEATQPARADLEAASSWPNARKPRCVRRGNLKYVRADDLGSPGAEGPGTYEQLFDLAADPGERIDLVRADPERAARELPPLRELLARWDAGAKPLRTEPLAREALEAQRRLRELGYVEGAEDETPRDGR